MAPQPMWVVYPHLHKILNTPEVEDWRSHSTMKKKVMLLLLYRAGVLVEQTESFELFLGWVGDDSEKRIRKIFGDRKS